MMEEIVDILEEMLNEDPYEGFSDETALDIIDDYNLHFTPERYNEIIISHEGIDDLYNDFSKTNKYDIAFGSHKAIIERFAMSAAVNFQNKKLDLANRCMLKIKHIEKEYNNHIDNLVKNSGKPKVIYIKK